jgi:hypothetical protein
MFSVVQANAKELGSDLDWGMTECVVQVKDGGKAAASRRTPIGIGGVVAHSPLPHHRTCGSAYGGSAS